MACRGVYFALNTDDAERLRSQGTDQARLGMIQDEIEEAWDEDWLCQVDKAWDAIHRCLTDGSLNPNAGLAPLGLCVLGGQSLYEGDDYIMSLLDPNQVREVSSAIGAWDEAQLRSGYERIPATDYDGNKSAEDFGYTWSYFSEVKEFFRKATEAGRWIVFTVDQ